MKIFGLLFYSFDKFKIIKSHYMSLRFFALLINVIFVSQVTGIKHFSDNYLKKKTARPYRLM